MNALSSHGRLVYLILNVHSVTQDGITTFTENSSHLIIFHIMYSFNVAFFNMKRFNGEEVFVTFMW